MANTKGQPRTAFGLMWRTRPFLLSRLVVYGVFFFATIGFIATVFWLLALVSQAVVAQLFILLVAAGGYLLGRRYLRRNLTYVGQAPHLMAMVDVLKGTELPRGDRLVDVSTRRVEGRYDETTRLLRLEVLVGKVLRQTRENLIPIADFRPLPGFSKLKKGAEWILSWSFVYIREAIVGYTLHEDNPNVWDSARSGLVLYAQTAERLAKAAVRIYIAGLTFGLLMIGLMLIPTLKLLDQSNEPGFVVLIVLFAGMVKAAWVLKRALYEPYAMASILPTYLRAVDGLKDEPDWEVRLEDSSKRFREIRLRAENFTERGDADLEDEGEEADEQGPAADETEEPESNGDDESDEGKGEVVV